MKESAMPLISKVAIGTVAVIIIGAGGVIFLRGSFGASTDTHPPCGELPTAVEASAALNRNKQLAADIEALGREIAVGVGSPCPEDQDRALIQVTYGSKPERDAIASLLARRDGFGAPVHLIKR